VFNLKCLFVLLSALFLIGCAHHMPIAKGENNIDLSKQTIALLSVKVSNQHKPEYQPNRLLFFAGGSAHVVNEIYKSEKDSFNSYLVNLGLKPGMNRFEKIWFIYAGVFVGGHATIPLEVDAEVKGGSVTYLGHLNLAIRSKNDSDEPTAGPLLPLIDQAVTGFSTGTYDFIVEDRFDEDIKLFTTEYPVLGKVKVEKSILSYQVKRANKDPK
jgi:hypothetical protein